MSVAGYLGKSFRGAAVDRKDRSGIKETERVYEGVAQYDAVLRSHCGLDAVGLGRETTAPCAYPAAPATPAPFRASNVLDAKTSSVSCQPQQGIWFLEIISFVFISLGRI